MSLTEQEAAKSFDVPPERRPRHIAMIMDGNGRWAQRRGLSRSEGHGEGIKNVRRVLEECKSLGVKYVTLYCFSSENWKRPEDEVSYLFQSLEHYANEQAPKLAEENVRMLAIGRWRELPPQARDAIERVVAISRENTGMTVCWAVNYGARAEIVDATRRIAAKVAAGDLAPDAIDESTVSEHLDTAGVPDPDLLIRTAGEMRISNYLLWQISYAELWVTPTLWPDFDEEHVREAIRAYASRSRRFGGLR